MGTPPHLGQLGDGGGLIILDARVEHVLWDIGNADGGYLLPLGHASLSGRVGSGQNFTVGGVSNVLVLAVSGFDLFQQFPGAANGAGTDAL